MTDSQPPSPVSRDTQPGLRPRGLSDAQFSVLQTVLRLVANGAIGIITARGLGPVGRGIFALIVTFHNTIVSLGRLGLAASGVYFVGKRVFPLRDTVSSGLTASLLAGGASALLGAGAAYLLRNRLFVEVSLLWPLLGVALVPFVIATSMAASLLLGFGKVKTFNWSQSTGAGLELGLLSILWVLGFLTAQTAIVAWAAAFLVAALYSAVKLRLLGSLRPRWRPRQLGQMFRFGLQSFLSEAALQLNMRFDFLLVSLYTGHKGLGLYSTSALLSQFPWIFPHGFSYALYPRVTSSALPEAVRLTEKGMRHAFLLSLLTSGFLSLTAKYLVPGVFGRQFSGSIVPLLVLLPGALFFGLTWLHSMFLIGQAGKPLKVGYAYLLILLSNIILNVLLTPRYGILGAAIASSISRLAGCLVLFQMVASESNSSWRNSLLLRREDLTTLRQEFSALARLARGNRSEDKQ